MFNPIRFKKSLSILFTIILLALMFCSSAIAHPGMTDSNGGHYNLDTGEYHYHHGYPEHQHRNGICPYKNDKVLTETKVEKKTESQEISPVRSSSTKNMTVRKSSSWISSSLTLAICFLIIYIMYRCLGNFLNAIDNNIPIYILIIAFTFLYALLYNTDTTSIETVTDLGYTFSINMFIPILCVLLFQTMELYLMIIISIANSILAYFYFIHDIDLRGGTYSPVSGVVWCCINFIFLYWNFERKGGDSK